MEIGIGTLGDLPQDQGHGDAGDRLAQIIREAEAAEAAGLDVVSVGEHHSPDFAVSSPAVVLSAIAARTDRLRLTSGVTVLGVHDPVRVLQDFATVDLISGGRAEITVGRSAFTEPFALFGYDLEDYDDLFRERLDLLLRLRDEPEVRWRGRYRAALPGIPVPPRPTPSGLPIWLGVGGSPRSAERAGGLGLPMIVGYLGGPPHQPAAMAEIYREAGARAGNAAELRLGIAVHLLITDDEKEARDAYPHYREFLRPKRPGGSGYLVSPQAYAEGRGRDGALLIGTVDQVAGKLVRLHEITRFDRLQVLTDWGGLPDDQVLTSITRLGKEIAPLLRDRVS
ncbi:LLM class flavin-dependent oxidoreductase [Lentzea sp. NPDC059081]|uniref:LLM class flavin-dependent oxidoreductase n=1 Tax=Lentzea sp. NPDC059081 TaxID=3346719 RepID=UPI0036C1042C